MQDRTFPPMPTAERYSSPEVARLERERLWPRTWLMACREEQVQRPGDFVTFDIAGESIVVIRNADGVLRAFYNVCQHRGRRLKEGCGNSGKRIFCPFHGWRWTIDGKLDRVVNREDWPEDAFPDGEYDLKTVRLDSFAGWIYVSMDPDIVPLAEYLSPINDLVRNFEIENCRIKWYKTIEFPVNWKTFLNAFNENYHVETTHSQLNKYGLTKAPARALGLHSQFFVERAASGSANLGSAQNFSDFFETIERRERERAEQLFALISEYSLAASKELRGALPADASQIEIVQTYRQLHRQKMEAADIPWPDQLTADDIAKAGIDLQIFPNMIILPAIDGVLVYRSRPSGDDPEKCHYDIWWLERAPRGKCFEYSHDVYPTPESFKGVNPFLEQDFSNMIGVQAGMRSRGFRGAKYNPVQEAQLINFERNLDRYLSTPPGEPVV